MKITVSENGKTSVIAFANEVELSRLSKQLQDMLKARHNFPAAHTIFANEITEAEKLAGRNLAQAIVNDMGRR